MAGIRTLAGLLRLRLRVLFGPLGVDFPARLSVAAQQRAALGTRAPALPRWHGCGLLSLRYRSALPASRQVEHRRRLAGSLSPATMPGRPTRRWCANGPRDGLVALFVGFLGPNSPVAKSVSLGGVERRVVFPMIL